MCKALLIAFSLLFVPLVFGQVADTTESDTLYVIEARAMVRFNLNDYGSTGNIWPDSVIDDWLHQSCWEIASQGVIARRDTIVTVANISWYLLNADFMRVKDVLIKYTEDNRWRGLIMQNDSVTLSEPEVVKRDTIITTANTVWYALNTDIMRVREVMFRDKGGRWKGLNPKSGIWARDKDIGINSYEIDGTYIRIDKPSAQAGDSIIVVYNPYYQGVKGYGIDGKYLRIDKTPADSGDSLIVVYFATANDLTGGDSVIVNLPYQYEMQIIQGAMQRAKTSNRE